MTDKNFPSYSHTTEELSGILQKIISEIYDSSCHFEFIHNHNSVQITRTIDNKKLNINLSETDCNLVKSKCNQYLDRIKSKILETFGSDLGKTLPDTKVQWIVKFKKDFNHKTFQWPNGFEVKECYNCALHGMCCLATQKQITDLYKKGNIIESYCLDHKVKIQTVGQTKVLSQSELQILAAQPAGSFIPRIGANHSSQRSGDGVNSLESRSDITVFVVDTGIAPHPDLNITGGRNFTTIYPDDWTDRNGHGTHVAGIIGAKDNSYGIVGVAPGVRLYAIKVLADDGSGNISGIISAINWIIAGKDKLWSGIGIINMSLGGPANTPLDNAVHSAIDKGIIVCIASGNSTINASNISPARVSKAITVGATGPNPTYNSIAYYSNYGRVVDILAPGTNINSTYLSGGYAVLSGTSMATPVVSGTIALLISSTVVNDTKNADFVTNIRNILVNKSAAKIVKNYDSTLGSNPRINLTRVAQVAGTTNISIWSGSY